MVTVSLCMIVKNEEDVLARCLESAVGLVDEMIIVDTGSTDRIREIAERLIKNHAGMRWEGAVHEAIAPVGRVIYSEFAVTHRKLRPSDPDRNLRIYETQLERGGSLEPRQQFYYGRELYYHRRYGEAVRVFERFLDEGRGWVENNIDACCHCAYCYERMERPEQALQALLLSFAYDRPRAEVCCELGRWFFQRDNMSLAAYWYALALTCPRDDRRGGFISPDCYGYLPCIQLCVCYSRMGDWERAERMNELAASFKPDAAPVLHNRAFFRGLKTEG